MWPIFWRRDWKPARPLIFGEFCDSDGFRDVAEIIAANGLKPPYTLKNGQALKIPVRDTGASAAPKKGDYVEAGEPAAIAQGLQQQMGGHDSVAQQGHRQGVVDVNRLGRRLGRAGQRG